MGHSVGPANLGTPRGWLFWGRNTSTADPLALVHAWWVYSLIVLGTCIYIWSTDLLFALSCLHRVSSCLRSQSTGTNMRNIHPIDDVAKEFLGVAINGRTRSFHSWRSLLSTIQTYTPTHCVIIRPADSTWRLPDMTQTISCNGTHDQYTTHLSTGTSSSRLSYPNCLDPSPVGFPNLRRVCVLNGSAICQLHALCTLHFDNDSRRFEVGVSF